MSHESISRSETKTKTSGSCSQKTSSEETVLMRHISPIQTLSSNCSKNPLLFFFRFLLLPSISLHILGPGCASRNKDTLRRSAPPQAQQMGRCPGGMAPIPEGHLNN